MRLTQSIRTAALYGGEDEETTNRQHQTCCTDPRPARQGLLKSYRSDHEKVPVHAKRSPKKAEPIGRPRGDPWDRLAHQTRFGQPFGIPVDGLLLGRLIKGTAGELYRKANIAGRSRERRRRSLNHPVSCRCTFRSARGLASRSPGLAPGSFTFAGEGSTAGPPPALR